MDELFSSNPWMFDDVFLECSKPIYSLSAYIMIALFLYTFLIYGTYEFIRIYRWVNRMLTMFFIMLNISFLTRVAFFSALVFYLKRDWEFMLGWKYASMANFCNLCFASSIIFMITNWMLVISRIHSYENIHTCSNQNIIISFCVCMQFVSFFVYILVVYLNCSENEYPCSHIENLSRCIVIAYSSLLSIILAWVGIQLYFTLKKVSIEKAVMMKNRIFMSIWLIWLPQLIKAIFAVFYILLDLRYKLIIDSLKGNTHEFSIYVLVYYVLLDLLPKAGQYIVIRIVVMHYYSSWDKVLKENSQFLHLETNSLISGLSDDSDSVKEVNSSIVIKSSMDESCEIYTKKDSSLVQSNYK